MTQGRCGSLALHRTTLSFSFATPRRFNPAYKEGTSMEEARRQRLTARRKFQVYLETRQPRANAGFWPNGRR